MKQVTTVLPYNDQLIPACKLRVIFNIALHMKNYFNFRDKTKRELRSL